MTKKKYYPDVNPNPDFPKLEEKTLAFWKENNTFQKSVDNRKGAKDFIFYDGPPFANGLPHYGHLLTGFVKDTYPRYQTMLGKRVERNFGWDCHGLPAEMGAEKELGVSGRAAIMNYGIDKFNDRCRADVMKFSHEWEKYVTRQARWVDFKNDYKTMDKSFMESVMWAFNELFQKGLVYEAMRVMPYSWAAETPLSNFETRLDNSYRERTDNSIYVAFELSEADNKNLTDKLSWSLPEQIKKIAIMAWTTTPWTLPSNLALAVNPKHAYDFVVRGDTAYVVSAEAKLRFEQKKRNNDKEWSAFHFDVEFEWKAPKTHFSPGVDTLGLIISGEELIGLSYKPIFPYFANQPNRFPNAFKIIAGDFIEEGSGTGVVHIAPGFGEDDFRIGQENNIGIAIPVDSSGRFTDEVPDYKGMNVFEANEEIIKVLKDKGSRIKTEQYLHSYPHCWRTDTPLIYKAMPSWYVEVTKFKDRMVELNKGINWIPENVRDGLFGKWLEGARDWSISRNRFWGAPIPIWRSQSGKLKSVGSIAELEKLSGKTVTDLHRPYIDEVKFSIDGEEYTRVEDVLDCWFESGSMPYASQGYPYNLADPGFSSGSLQRDPETSSGPAALPKNFPADFIVEYTAQTRGWFYTMMVLSTALFDKAPFKNCICHGVVLDSEGRKLSKRLNNYPDPLKLFDEYGSDALRWFMLSSPIMRGQELYIDREGKFIRDIVRLYIKPIWNAYNFFTLYANADGVKASTIDASTNLMDRYILAKCDEAVAAVQKGLNEFDTPFAYVAIEQFFEVLNNWYIRRSKERFWKAEADPDKQYAYDTLYTVLTIMCRAAAPLLPLITEEIYQNLTCEESVHLTNFPEHYHSPEHKFANEMDKVRDVCNAALSIRSGANIRVRQPLQNITIVGSLDYLKPFEDIIKDELNIKSIDFADDIAAHAEYKLKINFPILGKRLPEKMKQIIPATKKGEWKMESGTLVILGEKLLPEEYELLLEPKSKNNSAPLSTNDSLVVLDLNLTPELINEGLARDVVRLIQQARKDADLNVSDRIDLTIDTQARITNFKDYIAEQTLAKSVTFGAANGKHKSENELDGKKITIGFS